MIVYTYRMRTNNMIKATRVTFNVGKLVAWKASNCDTCIKSKQPAPQKILQSLNKKKRKTHGTCNSTILPE